MRSLSIIYYEYAALKIFSFWLMSSSFVESGIRMIMWNFAPRVEDYLRSSFRPYQLFNFSL